MKIFKIIKKLFIISYLSIPFNYIETTNFNIDDCCNELEHNHLHEKQNIKAKNQFVDYIPNNIVFSTNETGNNYGSITIEANFSPAGSVKQTLWSSSDTNKIIIESEDYSNIAKLICVNPFDDSVIIRAQAKDFPEVYSTINCTYDSGIIITNKVNSVTLNGVYNYACSGSSITLGNEFDKELLTNIFETTDDSKVGYKVVTGGSYASIDGLYLKQISRSNYTSGVVRCYELENETNYKDVSFNTTSTSNTKAHNYVSGRYNEKAASCTSSGYYYSKKCSVCSNVSGYTSIPKKSHTYSYWRKTSSATCTSPEKGYYECLYCSAHLSETSKGSALGHDYSVWVKTSSATCQSAEKGYYKCSRCTNHLSETTTGSKISHWSDEAYTIVYYCNSCGREMNYSSSYGWVCSNGNCGGDGYAKRYQEKQCNWCSYIIKSYLDTVSV